MLSLKVILKLVIVAGLTVLLLISTVSLLTIKAKSVPVSTAAAAATDVVVTVSAASTVVSGRTITYTISVINNSVAGTANNIVLIDNLPPDTQGLNVHCDDCTQIIGEVIAIPLGQGYPGGEITITQQITWPTFSLGPGDSREFIVTIDVPCKPAGTILGNQAFISYEHAGGIPGAGISNEAQTTVLLPLNQTSGPGLADEPSWCADNIRAVFDLDWGDYDRDGDLDLALASTAGTAVYESEEGQLTPFWDNPSYTLGVHWADIITSNNSLELVSIGNRIQILPPFTSGLNYVFELEDQGFTLAQQFDSDLQLGRVVSGDFNNDNTIDLIVSTNFPEHDTLCLVLMYPNIGNSLGTPNCVSQAGSTNLNAADHNNDGLLDLALSEFDFTGGGQSIILLNNGSTLTDPIQIDAGLTSTPSEVIWGDYDRDGFLDLAEAIPRGNKKNQVRILHSNGTNFAQVQVIPTVRGPFAIDWADFDGDGFLDLAIEDVPPTIYRYTGSTPPFEVLKTQDLANVTRIRRMRGADQDNDGDIDLSLTDLFEPSQLFDNVGPLLAPALRPVGIFRANSVAWGDANGDDFLDLLFGAGPSELGSKIYFNSNGNFTVGSDLTGSGFGPQRAVFGDANDDGKQDIGIATLGLSQIYFNGNTASPNWRSPASFIGPGLAWADADLDNAGRLDLLTGGNGPIALFLNAGLLTASSAPAWSSTETDNTQSLAWGYYDNDIFPDFAAGNQGQPTRVYRNVNGRSFELAWSSSTPNNTRSVAWGDFDSDGDMDLAVGNFGQPNYIYENLGNTLSSTPVWSSKDFNGAPVLSRTTSLAWGDWNNDGRLDLAVGNYGEKDQVYANLGTVDIPDLVPVWQSQEKQLTTDIAWGDQDNDGDLDLAVSQDGSGANGVYENTYILPAHLINDFTTAMPLPQNPSYLSIARPGQTDDAYFFSSAEVFEINAPLNPPTDTLEIPITFKVYDPDGTRDTTLSDEAGDRIAKIDYQFSLDGGGTWRQTTSGVTTYNNQTSRLGQTATYTWNAGLDLNTLSEAVSDNARFRITVVYENKTGPVQRSQSSAVSPPFRIRKLTCTWPNQPLIQPLPPLLPGQPSRFLGNVLEGQGVLTFTWDFGDGQVTENNVGQLIEHIYKQSGQFTVTLTVVGESCPIARQIATATVVDVGGASVYLPLVQKGTSVASTVVVTKPGPDLIDNTLALLVTGPEAPASVKGLSGAVQTAPRGIKLSWNSDEVDDDILGYRIYRSSIEQAAFQNVATLPADVTSYVDETTTCGAIYFVTAYNTAGESLASTTSYASPPCR